MVQKGPNKLTEERNYKTNVSIFGLIIANNMLNSLNSIIIRNTKLGSATSTNNVRVHGCMITNLQTQM